ncbi:MAG: Gfo/Idh/MocA family oxidoreductase [Candidatus Cloacimonadota bacterium]|nr:MAG: Gfo/Idh/MocA family oxidoreductase [Candidatus Cloacimonadota bacterium]
MNESKIRVGIIGTGAVTQMGHIPAFKSVSKAELIALCDEDGEKLKLLAKKHKIPKPYTDYEKIVADKAIDALVIATPNYLHLPMIKAACSAQKHILCEKPLARTSEEALKICDVVNRTKVKFMLGLNNRFRPDVQILKKFIDGELGRIFYAKTGWLQREDFPERSSWKNLLASSGGGALLNLGIHLLDEALWLLGCRKVKSVVGSAHFLTKKREVEDSAIALLNMEDDITLTIEVSWTLLFDKDFTYFNVFGNNGSALLNPLKIYKRMQGEIVNVTPSVDASKNAFKLSFNLQAEHFVESIRRGKTPIFRAEEGLEMAKIIDAIYKSARKKKEIKID